jgi:hypothetical protein
VGEWGGDVAFGFCYIVSRRLGVSRKTVTQASLGLKFIISYYSTV